MPFGRVRMASPGALRMSIRTYTCSPRRATNSTTLATAGLPSGARRRAPCDQANPGSADQPPRACRQRIHPPRRTLVGMDEHGHETPEPESIPPHAGLRYALLRVLLMLVVGGVLYLIGMRTWPWLFATVLVSAALSFFVLKRQREAAARSLEASVSARAARRERSQGPADPGQIPTQLPHAEPHHGGGDAGRSGLTGLRDRTPVRRASAPGGSCQARRHGPRPTGRRHGRARWPRCQRLGSILRVDRASRAPAVGSNDLLGGMLGGGKRRIARGHRRLPRSPGQAADCFPICATSSAQSPEYECRPSAKKFTPK